jgi:hypothetical protein
MKPTRGMHENSLANLKHGGSPDRPQGLARKVRAKTQDGKLLARRMVRMMMGQPVSVGGRKRWPTVADQIRACSWLADRAFGKPPTMIELMALDAAGDRRR